MSISCKALSSFFFPIRLKKLSELVIYLWKVKGTKNKYKVCGESYSGKVETTFYITFFIFISSQSQSAPETQVGCKKRHAFPETTCGKAFELNEKHKGNEAISWTLKLYPVSLAEWLGCSFHQAWSQKFFLDVSNTFWSFSDSHYQNKLFKTTEGMQKSL